MSDRNDDAPIDRAGDGRPAHPTRQAALLLVGVTVLIVVLAFLSATGRL